MAQGGQSPKISPLEGLKIGLIAYPELQGIFDKIQGNSLLDPNLGWTQIHEKREKK
jgi:hypothetical protein